jgi:hypothetical protein
VVVRGATLEDIREGEEVNSEDVVDSKGANTTAIVVGLNGSQWKESSL